MTTLKPGAHASTWSILGATRYTAICRVDREIPDSENRVAEAATRQRPGGHLGASLFEQIGIAFMVGTLGAKSKGGHDIRQWLLVFLKKVAETTIAADAYGTTISDNGIPESNLKAQLEFTRCTSNREGYVAPDEGGGPWD